MAQRIRRKVFISYHHDDQKEVEDFIKKFDEYHDVFLSRAVGMTNDLIDSTDPDYIMRRIREEYLTDSTVTIIMIGKCTWGRKYVDWEIASTLRNDSRNKRSGLVGITLPYMADQRKELPPRFKDNYDSGYAKWYKYPKSPEVLFDIIEEAYEARTQKENLVKNSRKLFSYNREC